MTLTRIGLFVSCARRAARLGCLRIVTITGEESRAPGGAVCACWYILYRRKTNLFDKNTIVHNFEYIGNIKLE